MSKIVSSAPPTYKLVDYWEEVKGSFYDKELQKVDKKDEVFEVKKILRIRRKRGVKEYFVKWWGYLDKFNSWVKETETTNTI